MNKQLLVDYTVFEVSPQQINESLTQNNGKLIVKGVLQRAEAKNQNGRIYPKETSTFPTKSSPCHPISKTL